MFVAATYPVSYPPLIVSEAGKGSERKGSVVG